MEKKDTPETVAGEETQQPGGEGASLSSVPENDYQQQPVADSPAPADAQPETQQAAQVTPPPVLVDPAEARAFLSAAALGGASRDPVLTNIANTTVLSGSFERSLFYSDLADDEERKAVKAVLCWLFILESDYLNYTGGRASGGMTLSQMLEQSRGLLNSANSSLKPLGDALDLAVRDSKVDDIQAINDIQSRIQATIEKLEGIVAGLSQPEVAEVDYAHQKFVAPHPEAEAEKGEAPKKVKKAVRKKREQREAIIKQAIALLIAGIILAAVGLYARSLLLKKPTLVIYDPNEYKDILLLKEARIEGSAFVGVVDENFWKGLSMDEKRDRAFRLLTRVKGGKIKGLLLRDSSEKPLAMTYGDEIKIFQ